MKTMVLAAFIFWQLLNCSFGMTDEEPRQDPHPKTLRVMTYNIWYVFAHGKEIDAGKAWVKSQTPDVVALQELTNIQPATLQGLADGWAHKHSVLLKTNGFSVGLTSRWPIEIKERRLKQMHHGFLHAKTAGINYFVIHLSPFKWQKRQEEAKILLQSIEPLLKEKQPVIVLGDFNSWSVDDRKWLESKENKLLEKKKKSDQLHAHVQNLKGNTFDYEVIEMFRRSGLSDTAKGRLAETFAARTTFPTGVFTDKKNAVTMGERIDFVLASTDLAGRVSQFMIPISGDVNKISDHYPVIVDFKK